MRRLQKLVAVFGLTFAMSAANAVPITLNFDTDLDGNALAGGTLLNDAYGGLGVTFNSTAAVRPGGGGVTSQPNFASGSGTNFNTTLEMIFDNFAIAIGASNVTNSFWTLTAFDEFGSVLGTVNSPTFPNGVLLSGIGNIKRATFSTTSQYGIDDLVFDAVHSVQVPEPATLTLLGLALLALGFSRRRPVR